jgi:hypothetical protein
MFLNRVVDPEWFVSDPTPDPTFKEVSAPTPDPDPLFWIRQRWSPPRESCAANSHCIHEITLIYEVFRKWINVKSVIWNILSVWYHIGKRIHNLIEKLLSEKFCFKFIADKGCPDPDPKWFIPDPTPDPDPAKSFGSDRSGPQHWSLMRRRDYLSGLE